MDDGEISLKTDNNATCAMLAKSYGTKRRNFIDLRHHAIQHGLKPPKKFG